jgi:hypothetical protein
MSCLLHSCNNLPTDTVINLDNVKACTSDDEASFNFISNNELGLTVRNYRHENIYRYSAKKAPWKPINGYREALGGQFSQYYVASGHNDQCESDWNIDILPSAAFAPSMGAEQVEIHDDPTHARRVHLPFPIPLCCPVT